MVIWVTLSSSDVLFLLYFTIFFLVMYEFR